MSRDALKRALKKPGRVMTWHAGQRNRSHKSSEREDYVTVIPKEMASLLQQVGSTTDVFEFLEIFLDELLQDQAYGTLSENKPDEDPEPIILELRGYFERWMEFYVREVAPPPPGPAGSVGMSWTDALERKQPRWLILANMNARSISACGSGFERLLDVSDLVARRYNLMLDIELARDGFRSLLRRRAEAEAANASTVRAPADWALLDSIPFR